jgi:hypothetical protein
MPRDGTRASLAAAREGASERPSARQSKRVVDGCNIPIPWMRCRQRSIRIRCRSFGSASLCHIAKVGNVARPSKADIAAKAAILPVVPPRHYLNTERSLAEHVKVRPWSPNGASRWGNFVAQAWDRRCCLSKQASRRLPRPCSGLDHSGAYGCRLRFSTSAGG